MNHIFTGRQEYKIINKIIEMAFVFASQRKLGESPQKEQFPSPAHYTIKEPQALKSCAPFRTTSIRKVAFEENLNKQIPGPGQYNISKQIIEPRITAYTNPSNVIIKVNSTGTPQFKSLSKRFDPIQKESQDQIQSYFVIKRQKKKLAKNPMINRTLNNSIKKIIPSIPTKIRGLLNPEKSQIVKLVEAEPGPGDYNINTRQKIISKGAIWGKDGVKRFNSPANTNNGGPGSYEIVNELTNRRHEETCNFKSGTVRTFFDTIMYNSSSEYIAEHRKKIDFKSPLPAPGQYVVQMSSLRKNQIKPPKFQFFGSSTKRFKNQEQNLIQSGSNSFYIPVKMGANKSFNHLNPSFNSSSERHAAFLSVGQQSYNPGPGQYTGNIGSIKMKLGKQIQSFGSTTERGTQFTKESALITSAVNQNQAQLENQLLKSRFGQLDTESSIFKSKTHRICFSEAKNVTLHLDYDITYNDVAKKIQRQRIHLQNLRKIDVCKPPFEINSPRFSHYEQWNTQKTELKDKKVASDTKQEKIEKKTISIGGKMGKEERFHSQRRGGGIPGVGNYEYKNQWKKNSHNVMFKHDDD